MYAAAEVRRSVAAGGDVTIPEFREIQNQLVITDGILMRSVKLPSSEIKTVPVIPTALEERVMELAHAQTGHASWETTTRFLDDSCYWPAMAEKCQKFVSGCRACVIIANPRRGESAPPTRSAAANGHQHAGVGW